MAVLYRVDKRNPRRKKLEHFKLKARVWIFRASYLLNLVCLLYLSEQNYGLLTTIYERVTPILETLLTKLPH